MCNGCPAVVGLAPNLTFLNRQHTQVDAARACFIRYEHIELAVKVTKRLLTCPKQSEAVLKVLMMWVIGLFVRTYAPACFEGITVDVGLTYLAGACDAVSCASGIFIGASCAGISGSEGRAGGDAYLTIITSGTILL